MTILYSLALTLWAFIANFFPKHFNILAILLINSYALGLIDKDTFGEFNTFDLNAVCLLVYLYYIVANFSFKRLMNSVFAIYFIILFIIYIFGVTYPYFLGNSSLFYSLKEGKEYIHYLAFFATFMCIKTKKDIKWSWVYIISLSIYYGLLEISYNLGLYKLGILHYLYRKDLDLGIIKVYQPIFSIVFLSLFYYLWETVIQNRKNYGKIIFLSLTALYTAFRSYILGSFIAIMVAVFTIFKGKHFYRLISAYSTFIVISIFLISITFSESLSERVAENFDNYVLSGIREFVYQEGGSIKGREAANNFRWAFFNERPLLGYGFIDKYSKLGITIYRKHNAELSMIDTGYLDVLLKFGILGAIIFYGIFLKILHSITLSTIRHVDTDIKLYGTTLLCFLLTILASQVTHAGLTYSFGIVPLSIGLGLFDSACFLFREDLDKKI